MRATRRATDATGHKIANAYGYADTFLRTWGDSTHKQACLQAITIATVNSTYNWMANKARRTLEDVLDVRARDRRPKLPPPVAQSGRAGAGVEREAEARRVA